MSVDLSVNWLGLAMASPLFNASGVMCRSREELDLVAASAAGAVVTKSCTAEAREGNPEPRYCSTPLGSINAMGLPNYGFAYYLRYAAEFDYRKPLFLSLSGMTTDDTIWMLTELRERGLRCLPEVNLSCPNLPGKPQLAYDFSATAAVLARICEVYPGPFGVKLPPYFDPVHFTRMAALLDRFDNLRFVTCINSLGNGLVVDLDSETAVLRPKGGLGGLGGDYVLPTALANVREFSRLMPDKHVIGCGGIKSGAEAFLHVLCGATAVQIGTCLYQEGIGAFARINRELAALMQAKGYDCLDAFRGRLKTL